MTFLSTIKLHDFSFQCYVMTYITEYYYENYVMIINVFHLLCLKKKCGQKLNDNRIVHCLQCFANN